MVSLTGPKASPQHAFRPQQSVPQSLHSNPFVQFLYMKGHGILAYAFVVTIETALCF